MCIHLANRCCFRLAFLSILLGPVWCQAASKVSFIIVDSGFEYPKTVIPIVSILPDGSLTRLEGQHKLTDRNLRQLLRRTRFIRNKKTCLVRLHTSSEKELTMFILGRVLQRLRSLADPDIITTIYIYFRELQWDK